jgi:uncharacterized protein (DUF488 family)
MQKILLCNFLSIVMVQKLIYTIGHSNQAIDEFRELVQVFNVNCIIDVRSVPASAYTPQFNQDALKYYLKRFNISYLHFGKEFGARRYDCLDKDNNVNFDEAVKTNYFQDGVHRLIQGIDKGYNVALMCSESQPIECHRFAMISRYLNEHSFDVKHILKEKVLATHLEIQNTMIAEYLKKKKISEVDALFGLYTAHQQVIDAYKIKNKEIAYHAQMEETL